MAEYPRVEDPPAPNPLTLRVQELRELLGECVTEMRAAKPEIARPVARARLESLAIRAERALLHAEAAP